MAAGISSKVRGSITTTSEIPFRAPGIPITLFMVDPIPTSDITPPAIDPTVRCERRDVRGSSATAC